MSLEEAIEAEWYNGNIGADARDRLLAAGASEGLDRDRLLCGNCGDQLLDSEIVGHLYAEGRDALAAVPSEETP